jgi:hypothetical protein
MGKQKRARSAAIPPVHNAHLVLPSALELHMAPINLACVAACVNQSSSSQPMPTRAECPPGICPRPQPVWAIQHHRRIQVRSCSPSWWP